jgi:NAD(P)-dependent dehydrogenase (short-subunit alcohol dehydrogenase family)
MAEERIAVVTGAGSGIGRAVAEQLGAAGYCVVLVARSRHKLEETAELVEGDTFVYPADVSEPDAVGMLIEDVMASFGHIDALVHVAGFAELMSIDKITPEHWRRTIDVNLTAAVMLTAAVWPTFTEQKSGVVVNVSSMASIDPFPGFATYAAAKIGVNMFTRCTAREGEAIGVRAVAVAPGAVETPMLRSMFDESMIPADKTLTPDAVAEVICDCVTGDRAFENGETIEMPNP